MTLRRGPLRGLVITLVAVATGLLATAASSGSTACAPSCVAYLPLSGANGTGVPADPCGVENFAWTVPGRLARGGQPGDDTWRCLREAGFTTVVRQNVEGGDTAERLGVEQAGMEYLGQYQIDNDTVYPPGMLEGMLGDVVARLGRGERVLVHDAAGRGRMGFWDAAFLLWDGRSSREVVDRFVAFGLKIGCDKGGNGQLQALAELSTARGQPAVYPARDTYGTAWAGCPRPAYMADWDYGALRWPEGGGQLWSRDI